MNIYMHACMHACMGAYMYMVPACERRVTMYFVYGSRRGAAQQGQHTSGRRGNASGVAVCGKSGPEGHRNSACTAPPVPRGLFVLVVNELQRTKTGHANPSPPRQRRGGQPAAVPAAHPAGLHTAPRAVPWPRPPAPAPARRARRLRTLQLPHGGETTAHAPRGPGGTSKRAAGGILVGSLWLPPAPLCPPMLPFIVFLLPLCRPSPCNEACKPSFRNVRGNGDPRT